MTIQTPERIILDDRPHELHTEPLGSLLESRGMEKFAENTPEYSTACWRGYLATWQIIEERLHLVHINLPLSESPFPPELCAKLLRAIPANDFPVPAVWFSGHLRIKIGRRIAGRNRSWWHLVDRERVITVESGAVTRDREVHTGAMLERCIKRNPSLRDLLDGPRKRRLARPLVWHDRTQGEERADWWPPDYVRPSRMRAP